MAQSDCIFLCCIPFQAMSCCKNLPNLCAKCCRKPNKVSQKSDEVEENFEAKTLSHQEGAKVKPVGVKKGKEIA